ncbi:DUF1642 domain-containing protein [Lacticaseibacillus manihotivorans]|nr:DUF1642 domain-containing protein [Lacticaseibacillus manihotivorans]QFQ90998.1 hypothetical protein LM010_05970 [Lacticaseibacillus manihotivorans]
MSLFAVKNDKGEWLGCEAYCDEPDWFKHGGFMFDIRDKAEADAKTYGGHVVELVEAQAKIVVSEEEDRMLKRAKNTTVWRPAAVISAYAYDNTKDPDSEALLEDRLMRAYINGWTVEKPKRWNVKVPLVQAQGGLWFLINASGKLDATYLQDLAKKFSMEEINTWGLQDCERKEVTEDDE